MKRKMLLTAAALMLLCLLFCCASAETGKDITDRCKFRGNGDVSLLYDGTVRYTWKGAKGDSLKIKLPEGGAGYLRLMWYNDSESYVIRQYDADNKPLEQVSGSDLWQGIDRVIPLNEETRGIEIKFKLPLLLCEVRVYSKGDLPSGVPDFEPPHEKVDLMVVSAHQDDEWLWFGGVMPYYEHVQGKNVQLVYMTDCNRRRRQEGINGAWAGKLSRYPIFLNLKDDRATDAQIISDWGGKNHVTEMLVELIRSKKPEVILTHDKKGEYGHPQHKLTTKFLMTAIKAAADPNKYPESAKKYGAWQVKKFYLHLATDHGAIKFDWSIPYEELDGLCPFECAELGYAEHKSQQKDYQFSRNSEYDNELFGLVYTTVGWDEELNDLFEHIDEENEAVTEPDVTEPEESDETLPG